MASLETAVPTLVRTCPLPADGRARVWAPAAAHVDLHTRNAGVTDAAADGVDVTAMSPDTELAQAGRPGWWVSAHALAPQTDYAFAVDGGDPRPDPRSPWQPGDVHDFSRTFDAADYSWGDAAWQGGRVLGSVLYELHLGTFTSEGTLDAAIDKLPYLVELGVDTVELMPVAAFPGDRGWGYDGVALYAVQESYGGPRALQRFVDAAHQAGLAVLLDVVYNHLGPAGNYLSVFGPYFTDKHHTPWGAAVNLDDAGSLEVRAFIVENALRWMRDFHIDGLRLDAVHALVDESEQHLLADLSVATAELERDLGRSLTLTAESDLNDPRMVTSVEHQTDTGPGLGQDGQWADDVHHALHALITGETHGYYEDFGSPQSFARVFSEVFLHTGTWSSFRGKIWGAPVPQTMNRHKFIVFSQNHDQVGNRAIGDRPSRTQSPGQLVGAAAVILLGPYTPMLFQGEEWGTTAPFQFFTDHEPELGALVSQGRMGEFAGHGWEELYGQEVTVPDPQDPSTFLNSKLPWEQLEEPEHKRILQAYRELIALRRREPDLHTGEATATQVAATEQRISLRRGSLEVLVSLSPSEQQVPLEDSSAGDAPEVLFAFDSPAAPVSGSVDLGAFGVLVLRHH